PRPACRLRLDRARTQHASLPGLRTLVRFRAETPNRARFDGLTRADPFADYHQRPADLADEARGTARGEARRAQDRADETSPPAPRLWRGDALKLASHGFTANLSRHPDPPRPAGIAH